MSALSHVVSILVKPKQDWEKIKTEPMSISELLTGYVCILALIPAIATFVSYGIIGVTVPFFGTFKFPIGYSIGSAVVSYLTSIASVYVAALVMKALAPSFDSTPDLNNAFKLMTFSYTPFWLGSIFNMISTLSFVSLLISLYSIFIMYVGVGPMMNTPNNKKAVYMIVGFIVTIVIYFVISLIFGMIILAFFPNPISSMFNLDNIKLN